MDIPISGIGANSVQWWQESGVDNLSLLNSPIGTSNPPEQVFESDLSSYIPREQTTQTEEGIQYFIETGNNVTLLDKYPYVDYKPNTYWKENDILSIEDLTFSKNKNFIINNNTELLISEYFRLNSSLGYSINTLVKKDTDSARLIDEYKTYLTENQDRSVNIGDSIGVGIGIKFYDENDVELYAPNLRDTHRLMAGSELSHTEYYNVNIDIADTSIPEDAVAGRIVLLVYGLSAGGFVFKKPSVRNLSKFFYCTQDHQSSYWNSPNSKDGLKYWTQDFVWRPSYGSKSDFVAINEELKMGEGKDYVTNMAINSLPMELNINFNNRTDKEAKAIIHFLQEKSFAYESIFSLDYKGDRLLSSEIGSFNFKYTYPYKDDLKYTCTQFNHSIVYRNNNNINAKFICNTESTLSSVESHAGYNKRIDALIPIFIDETTEFKEGEQITLNTFTLEEGDGTTTVDTKKIKRIKRYPEDTLLEVTGGIITFTEDVGLEEEDCVFIKVIDPKNSRYNVGKTKIKKKISETEYAFWPILEKGSEEEVANYRATSSAGEKTSIRWFDPIDGERIELRNNEVQSTDLAEQLWRPVSEDQIIPREEVYESEDGAQYFEESGVDFITTRGEEFIFGGNITMKHMQVCPEDCSYSKVLLPENVSTIPSVSVDPSTGLERKRQVYLKNYRRMQVDSDINEDTLSVTFTPLENFTLEAKDDFWLLISAVQGRSSIYLKDPNETPKFPWLEVRNFDHKPSLVFGLEQTPDHIQTSFTKTYNKRYKRGINSNLSTFNLTFEKRSDEEAAEILQFLESHLGYKKFRFQMPRPYLKDGSHLTSQTRPYMSTFYCPSWGHDVVYKNNHTISVTFIESATSIEEDLRSVFGIGREEDKPCYGAEIYDPITTHELCTFSSQLQAAAGSGLEEGGVKEVKRKEVDLVFVVKNGPSMNSAIGFESVTKLQALLDVIKKIAVAYNNYISPETKDYGGVFDAPAISFGDISGDTSVPPWPSKPDNTSLISSFEETLNDHESDKTLNQLLEVNGFNLENFKKFIIKINQKSCNMGIMSPTRGTPFIPLDLSTVPEGYDTASMINLVNQIFSYGSEGSSNVFGALGGALAQFYNSTRAQTVSERIIIIAGDGNFASNSWIDIADELRVGGDLNKRRPTDSTLTKNKVGIEMSTYTANEDTGQHNPDFGAVNPSWYQEEVPTLLMFASLGGSISRRARESVYDYNTKPDDPEFYYAISDGGSPAKEINRLISLIDATEILTEDSGSQNIFSITLYNCGPHAVDILNTLINSEEQRGSPKYHTEYLKSGIPKGKRISALQYIESSADNYLKGYGGQYFGDFLNQRLLTSENNASNILWESFNTQYEVYREGKAIEVDGGWEPNAINSMGVKNIGVASKGMPVRVFELDSGLQVIDYNIGGVDIDNKTGNYNHIPKLMPGEKIDLFFGFRSTQKLDKSETVQFLFNSKDHTKKKMDCFANFNVKTSIKSFKPSVERTLGVNFDADWIIFTYEFTSGRDLDTRTRITGLSGDLGWARGGSWNGVLEWGGDNLGQGVEGCKLNIAAWKAGGYGDVINLEFRAFWYGSRGNPNNPVGIKAALYRGGTAIHDGGYGYINPTAEEQIWVKSLTKTINTQTSSNNNGDPITRFSYNTLTTNGIFSPL